jgi:hypothetical protein
VANVNSGGFLRDDATGALVLTGLVTIPVVPLQANTVLQADTVLYSGGIAA